MTIKILQAIRGMNDVLPLQSVHWQKIESVIKKILNEYAYSEIRLPLLEKTELFARGIGEVTDIVEKEMYTFLDRNEESLTLRPEGTAGCVRAAIEHGLLYHQQQKLWYSGPMFRYERPQKGRYRQFHHIGIETFGFSGYLIELELLLISARIWKMLGIEHKLNLHLNCLGNPESRQHYRQALVNYCEKNIDQLDADSQKRLQTNPLRILDSKNEHTKQLLENAPKINEYLDEFSAEQFNQLTDSLKKLGVNFDINPYLVRGLDYYTGMVFEWITPHLGAQSAVCSGGRYDGLVTELGGPPTPAVGFAIGMERLVLLCEDNQQKEILDAYLVFTASAEIQAMQLAEKLRDISPGLSIEVNTASGISLKSQFKRADKSGARFAFILGEDELQQNMITCKNLRKEIPQIQFSLTNLPELIAYLRSAQ